MVIPILLSIASIFWLTLLYAGIGRIICKLFGLTFTSRLLRILAALALGFGIVGNTIMVLCFLQKAQISVLLTILVLYTLIGAPFYKRIVTDILELLKNAPAILKRPNRMAAILLMVLIGGYAARGLLPPTGFDALMYHLSTIKLYLQHGGFRDIYFNAQSDYPMLTEMNFMIGLVLNNDIICKTLSFMLAAMTLAAIAFLCKFYFNNTRIIIPSLLIFCTFTCVIANMSNCDVDIPQALWTVLALITLEQHLQNKKNRYLIIAAVLAGMAVQTKIFGVFAVPVILMRYLLHQKKAILSTQGITGVLMLCGIPFLMGMPWYIKSYIYNGTILSISHSSIVGQGLANPMGIQCPSDFCYWLVTIFVRIVAAPWTFSIFPGQHCGDTFGPLFIAVLPFLFLIKKTPPIKIVLILIATFLAEILFMEIWFIQAGTTIRYSMFVLLIGSPLIAWTVSELGEFPKIQKMLYAMMTIVVCLGALLFVKRYHKEWIALLTFQRRDEYYRSVLPEYPVIETINSLPEGEVVMPVYNYTDYLLEVPYITAHRHYSSPDEMKIDFREKNIGYIFANDKLDPSKNRTTFGEITDKVCIDSTNGYYLFKLDME